MKLLLKRLGSLALIKLFLLVTTTYTVFSPSITSANFPKKLIFHFEDEFDLTYYSGAGMGYFRDTCYVGAHYHKNIDPTPSYFCARTASELRWCAVSQDLLWINGGQIMYGDTVIVSGADEFDGYYIVKDAMDPSVTKSIDILVSNGEWHPKGRWQVKLTHIPKQITLQ